MVSFTIFVNYSASDVTPDSLGTAFKNGLSTQALGNTTKRILGTNYVLATSSDAGAIFTPSLDNIVGKRLRVFYIAESIQSEYFFFLPVLLYKEGKTLKLFKNI